MTDLKPCPFCGAPAKMMSIPGSYGYYPGKRLVGCTACDARSIEFADEEYVPGDGMIYTIEEAERAAIEWWNRRINQTEGES
jgi:Lar family restriction alleviation protein